MLYCFLYFRVWREFVSSLDNIGFRTWAMEMCVAVAEWSKAPISLFCVRSRKSPAGIEPSHGAHRHATLVVDGGFLDGPQLPYL